MKTTLTYFACIRCQKIDMDISKFSRIVSGFEMAVLWCNDCIAKHLNTSEVVN